MSANVTITCISVKIRVSIIKKNRWNFWNFCAGDRIFLQKCHRFFITLTLILIKICSVGSCLIPGHQTLTFQNHDVDLVFHLCILTYFVWCYSRWWWTSRWNINGRTVLSNKFWIAQFFALNSVAHCEDFFTLSNVKSFHAA